MQTRNPQAFWLENLKQADRYNNWIFQQIEPYLGENVLEVGCGNGNFTVFLAEKCDRSAPDKTVRLVAVDIDSQFVTLCKERLQAYPQATAIEADITTTELASQFDTIVLLDVLEHIENDATMLQKLFSLLEPGGNLIIKVPALNSIYGEMDRAIGHYRRYSQQSLIHAFEKASISELKSWYFNIAGIPGWWFNSKVLRRTTPPENQVGLFNRVVPILSVMEELITVPVGLSLFAIARKPN